MNNKPGLIRVIETRKQWEDRFTSDLETVKFAQIEALIEVEGRRGYEVYDLVAERTYTCFEQDKPSRGRVRSEPLPPSSVVAITGFANGLHEGVHTGKSFIDVTPEKETDELFLYVDDPVVVDRKRVMRTGEGFDYLQDHAVILTADAIAVGGDMTPEKAIESIHNGQPLLAQMGMIIRGFNKAEGVSLTARIMPRDLSVSCLRELPLKELFYVIKTLTLEIDVYGAEASRISMTGDELLNLVDQSEGSEWEVIPLSVFTHKIDGHIPARYAENLSVADDLAQEYAMQDGRVGFIPSALAGCSKQGAYEIKYVTHAAEKPRPVPLVVTPNIDPSYLLPRVKYSADAVDRTVVSTPQVEGRELVDYARSEVVIAEPSYIVPDDFDFATDQFTLARAANYTDVINSVAKNAPPELVSLASALLETGVPPDPPKKRRGKQKGDDTASVEVTPLPMELMSVEAAGTGADEWLKLALAQTADIVAPPGDYDAYPDTTIVFTDLDPEGAVAELDQWSDEALTLSNDSTGPAADAWDDVPVRLEDVAEKNLVEPDTESASASRAEQAAPRRKKAETSNKTEARRRERAAPAGTAPTAAPAETFATPGTDIDDENELLAALSEALPGLKF